MNQTASKLACGKLHFPSTHGTPEVNAGLFQFGHVVLTALPV